MKSKISIFALSLATVCMVSSCLGGDDTETTSYDDTAITGFKLGTLKYYRTVKAKNGVTDSITVTTFAGSNNAITIDQYNRTITNAPDSFPVGTDLSKVIISSVSSYNGGYVYLKSLTSDSLSSFSTSDSLDFSQPRVLRVYASSVANYRDYTVNLVAHKEYADSFKWMRLDADNDLKNYVSVKAGMCNNNLVVLGKTADGTELRKYDGGNWTKVKTFGAGATMTSDGKVVYVSDAGVIYTSTDADLSSWNTDTTDVNPVLGVCGNEMFGMMDNQLMLSRDKGVSWYADSIDEDASLLPSSDYSFIATNTTTNTDIKRAFLIGNSASSSKAVVWSKIIEEDAANDQPWIYQEFTRTNYHYLPNLKNLNVVSYADGMIAIGGDYDKIYFSGDCGVTWKNDSRFSMPSGFSADAAAMTTDNNGYIWIVCTGSGQVWKGCLNAVAWKKK